VLSWRAIWFYWLLAVFLSWLALELGAVALAHARGDPHLADYTLSDTIRRWNHRYRWLGPVVVGTAAFLLYHLLIEANP
jgi:hypothetical protein